MANKKTSKTSDAKYTATVKVSGVVYSAQGKTAKDAIDRLSVPNAHGMSILTVSKGKQSKEKILPPIATSRLFNTYGFSREVQLNNMNIIFADL